MADTPAVTNLHKLCCRYLDEAGLRYLHVEDQHIGLPFDHLMVHVTPHQWGADQTVVAITTVTNEEMRIDAALYEYLAHENAAMLFGKLCLYEQRRQVRFEHPLLGDFLNRDELATAVKVVGTSSLAYEAKIKERWGGR